MLQVFALPPSRADDHGVARGERAEVAEVEGVESVAARTAGAHEMKRIVDSPARQVSGHGQTQGVAVVIRGQRDHSEPGEDALLNHAFGIGGKQPGLEWQRREGGEEFGKAVGGEETLRRSLFHLLESAEGKDMVGVLLEKGGDERGGVKTGLHES